MNIGIIDADLIGRKKHRFPNLASMKISGFYKDQGHNVELLLSYEDIDKYDKVFLSKVFTDTVIPDHILDNPIVEFGGTGFFYDIAPKLSLEIEHHMPDYHLYDEWVNQQLQNGEKRKDYAYYLDYSIGFLTRGCFRQCEFCVNKNYKKSEQHSPLEEFVDPERKKICLLDDNFLACSNWKSLLLKLKQTDKRFQFKQGLDERLLTDEKCELLFSSKYDGDYIFAFDNIEDYALIEQKLKIIRKYYTRRVKFYVLCGFDINNIYDDEFWYIDILNTFKRIELLIKYNAYPYIMRFNRYIESPYKGIYVTLARWCNQPSMFNKMSFAEFCEKRQDSQRYYNDFCQSTDILIDHKEYLYMKFNKE